MSGLDQTAIPHNLLARVLELERRQDDLEGYAALPVVDPSGEGETTYISIVEEVQIGEGPGIDLTGASPTQTIGLGGDTILLYDSGDAPVSEYATTALDDASSAATDGDVVELPAGTISGDHTLKANVTYASAGYKKTILSGEITLGDGTIVWGCRFYRDEDDAGTVANVVPPTSGLAYVVDCDLICQNATGDGYAINGSGAHLELHDCYVYAESAGSSSNPLNGSGATATYNSTESTTKALSLWNGAGNDSEPADWTETSFDDSGWSAAVDTGFAGNIATAETLWASSPSQAQYERVVMRQTLTLTSAEITGAASAILTWEYEDHVIGVWVNGTQVVNETENPLVNAGAGQPDAPYTVDVLAYLQSGTNVIAYEGEEPYVPTAYEWGSWKLDIVYGAPYVADCEIPNADGRAAALPLYGDRASWRTDYESGATHADDWASGDSHHAAVTLAADADAVLGLSGQEIQLDAQSANTFLGGPTSGGDADPTFRAPVNADLPDPLAFKNATTTLTISGGAVTATQNLHAIAAETGTADDLDTISGLVDRQWLLLTADAGDTITVKHGTGNIHFDGGQDFALSGSSWLLLFYDGTNAVALGTASGASELTVDAIMTDANAGIMVDANGNVMMES